MFGTMLVTAAVTVATTSVAQAQSWPPANQTEFGAPMALGGGSAQTFLHTTRTGRPVFFGVQFAAGTLDTLPEHGGHPDEVDLSDPAALLAALGYIALPANAGVLPFTFVTLGWNPEGHAGPGWDAPHFDLHLYIDDMASLAEIQPGDCYGTGVSCDALFRGMAPLPATEQPPGYYDVGAVAPFMGNHLIDPTSPEFNGGAFTSSWLYGKWDGHLSFLEPMITLDHINSVEDELCTSISVPETFPVEGWYPTEYCVRNHGGDGTTTISVQSFEWFDATW